MNFLYPKGLPRIIYVNDYNRNLEKLTNTFSRKNVHRQHTDLRGKISSIIKDLSSGSAYP